MAIELESDTQVHTMWFAETAIGNLLAALTREPGKPWRMQIRLRLFVDNKVFDSADRRVTLGGELAPDADVEGEWPRLDTSICSICTVLLSLRDARAQVQRMLIRGTGDDAMQAMVAQPWGHLEAEDTLDA